MKLLERAPPVRDEPRRAPEVIIPEARRRARRRLRIGLAAAVVVVAGTVGGVVGSGGGRVPQASPARLWHRL